ncbi:MAG TPA: hypothetical protein VGJ91_01160 [Polyangiaceae bacterium]
MAGGCGHETFDLLPDSVLNAGGSAGGDKDSNAGAGVAGSSAASGKAGMGGFGTGFGGRFGSSGGGTGGGTDYFPCLGDGGCSDEDPFCPSSYPFCVPCRFSKDCPAGGPGYCDPDLKRCVGCRDRSQCEMGETCNLLTRRCAKVCEGNDVSNCAIDSQRFLCRPEFGDADCAGYGPLYGRCYLYACMECYDDRQCISESPSSPSCMSGRCVKH